MKQFFKDFNKFITKGNVMDLAVAVIIGASFNAIIQSLVKDVINPFLGYLVGKPDFSSLFVVLSMPADYAGDGSYADLVKAGATVLGYGSFLTAVFQFLIYALVIFTLVRIVNTIRTKLQKEEEAKPAAPAPTPEDIALLREIRDLLKK